MYIIALIIVICAVMFYGSCNISSSFYLKSLCSGCSSSIKVAITFDDGVDPDITPKVLKVLHKYQAKGTFFIIGEKANQHPEIVRQIVEQGHSIGNHSYYHQGCFPTKSSAAISKEIEMCSQSLKRATGIDVQFFRPPFGVTNPMIGKAVRQSGLRSIGWSIRSLDTMGGAMNTICSRVTNKLKAGSVILLHDNLEGADLLLDAILMEVQKRGLKPVTINELFDIK